MSWAYPATWHSEAAPSSIVHCRMHFGYNNRTRVERMARRVSNPLSRWYRRYPSVKKFTEQFAPTPAYLSQVTRYLTAQGFNIAYEAVNRKYIAFDGTVVRPVHKRLPHVVRNVQCERIRDPIPAIRALHPSPPLTGSQNPSARIRPRLACGSR